MAPEAEEIDIEEFLAKVDRESDYRRLRGGAALVISVIAIAFSLFQLYTAFFGLFDAMIQRAIHLSFGLVLIFLLYPLNRRSDRRKIQWWDVIFALLGAITPLYLVVFYQQLVNRAGLMTGTDLVIGVLGTLLVLEAARRVVGWPMLTVVLLFLGYVFAGPYLPGMFAHRGASVETLVQHLFFTTEGIFGIPLGVSATFIFLFILFGAFLEKTGIGKFFIDLANAAAGWAAGGPAKVAVISSALEGTVSGSSVANTVGSGSFTIPLMKSLGYRPEFAAAVEAAASTGGQLMPPIMGAAAFLMAEFLKIPYVEVAKAAAIPAILYFLGIWIEVHFEAKKLGLRGLKREELPNLRKVFTEKGHLFLPLAAIIYLLVEGFTPMKAALYAILLSIVASLLRQSTRIGFKDIIAALEQGARATLGVVAATATAGIIVGVVTLTGLGLKLASNLVDLAGGNLLLTLFFTMITSLILGMGVPTTANYVITSTIAAPALIMLGIPRLGAHLFAFYFGIIADVTPPVALAAYAGSGIAKSNPMQTGIQASKLAIAAFLIPYIFVLSPSLLLINATWGGVIHIAATATLGMIGVGTGVVGYLTARLTWYERVMLFAGGLLLIDPGLATDLIGAVLLSAAYLLQRTRTGRGQ
ncbi:MAG: TRAP transporter permease [Firmicutes bacterium]|nr:TRAP transporter permease [Bacillota bacterium]MCL5040264.1 TRAP transporter permease [Bacillota bacterium]